MPKIPFELLSMVVQILIIVVSTHCLDPKRFFSVRNPVFRYSVLIFVILSYKI